VFGVDESGSTVVKKKLRRKQLFEYFANRPPCLVGMEACGGSHHWARELIKPGYEVRLISPQFVKPYIKGNKNDYNDAEGICEAVGRANMRFGTVKSIERQDLQGLHRIRQSAASVAGDPARQEQGREWPWPTKTPGLSGHCSREASATAQPFDAAAFTARFERCVTSLPSYPLIELILIMVLVEVFIQTE
jgi:hypothetical protein